MKFLTGNQRLNVPHNRHSFPLHTNYYVEPFQESRISFLHNTLYNQFKVDLTEFRNRIALCNDFTSNFVLKHPIVEDSTSERPGWDVQAS